MDSVLIHSFSKNESEEIRLSLREYKARHYLDLRLFFLPTGENSMAPSKKGITIAVEFLPELKRGFLKLEEEVRQLLTNRQKD